MTFPELSSSPKSLTFAKLGLNSALLKALPAELVQPTRVQQLAIPVVLAGQDVLALAQTGSGKTLAFGLPLLQKLQQSLPPLSQSLVSPKSINTAKHNAKGGGVYQAEAFASVLILVPTRELAMQVTEALQTLASNLFAQCAMLQPITIQTLCGGVELETQLAELAAKPQVLVATPGRLLDLCQQSHIALSAIKYLVFDEADRLLEMGFWPDIQKLLALIPKSRQTLLFSATFPPALEQVASQLLNYSAQRIEAQQLNSVVAEIEEQLYLVNKGSKAQVLIALLKQYQWPQVLVFISARDDADAVAKRLAKAGMKVAALHGEKDQTVRSQTLADFKANKLQVLVATDLMARGIHVDALPVVINLDLPMSAPVYVHRIGRTARAGAKGLAISLVCHSEMPTLAAIRTLTTRELPLALLADFPVTDKPSEKAADVVEGGKVERKRAPRDKQANRRSINKHSAKEFKGKR